MQNRKNPKKKKKCLSKISVKSSKTQNTSKTSIKNLNKLCQNKESKHQKMDQIKPKKQNRTTVNQNKIILHKIGQNTQKTGMTNQINKKSNIYNHQTLNNRCMM